MLGSAHDLFLSVENSYSPSFRNCELVLLNGLHYSGKKSDPFADHPTYRNRLSMVKSFPRNTEGVAVGNVELAHRRSPIGRLSWGLVRNSRWHFRMQPHAWRVAVEKLDTLGLERHLNGGHRIDVALSVLERIGCRVADDRSTRKLLPCPTEQTASRPDPCA